MRTPVLREAQILAGLFAACFMVPMPASAVEIVEIEEHWQLSVGGPDRDRSAPQVTMTMSPQSNLNADFFVVTLNHWSHPQFQSGGIQAQLWCGDDCQTATASEVQNALNHSDETVTWVQRLSLADGVLTFEVVDGSSTTWGTFGNSDKLKLTTQTSLTQLNDYRPAISLGESGISYAGNRVSSLVLTKLRWKTAEGDEDEMVAPIDIDTDLDP